MDRKPKDRSWILRAWLGEASPALILMLVLGAFGTQSMQAQTYTVLHTFTEAPDGANSGAKLIRDSAGNLYGTTVAGGDPNCDCGTVFKVDTRGHLTTLYIFKGGTDGGAPIAPLVRDASGNLYGTANFGGDLAKCIDIIFGCGVVFKVDKMGHETVLHTFEDGADGARPNGLIRDSAGNLYGTAQAGGDQSCTDLSPVGCGTVYKLSKTGHFSVLHKFANRPQDGKYPWAGVIRDAAGNLYGTTTAGGTSNFSFGTVFKVDTKGKETLLHSFAGYPNDGNDPRADLILDPAGNLYGTTFFGGSGGSTGGTVFKVDTRGKETVLYNFKGISKGEFPYADLVLDSSGNLYGTTAAGGGCDQHGCGTIFKLDKRGKLTVLYNFNGMGDGVDPQGGLVRDAAGNLYGTTFAGGDWNCGVMGNGGCGTVFKFKP